LTHHVFAEDVRERDRVACGRNVIASGFAVVTLLASVLLGKSGTANATKDSAYECGMLPIGDAQPRFSVKFYMVAMLFVLFDIEVVFMYPWALVFRDLIAVNSAVFWSMASFATILLVAYLYALRKGALKWND
jgi:NADH-quinone oxidoreductase subunit A